MATNRIFKKGKVEIRFGTRLFSSATFNIAYPSHETQMPTFTFSAALALNAMDVASAMPPITSILGDMSWRHPLPKGNSTFGRGFSALEQQLRNFLTQLLERLKEQKFLAWRCDFRIVETVIYNLHNARFIEFSSSSDVSRKVIDALIIQDLGVVLEHIS